MYFSLSWFVEWEEIETQCIYMYTYTSVRHSLWMCLTQHFFWAQYSNWFITLINQAFCKKALNFTLYTGCTSLDIFCSSSILYKHEEHATSQPVLYLPTSPWSRNLDAMLVNLETIPVNAKAISIGYDFHNIFCYKNHLQYIFKNFIKKQR